MTASLTLLPNAVADLEQARFDRALELLHDLDPGARVSLDTRTGLARGTDGSFTIPMPAAAKRLPQNDRADAAAVLFLDRYGALFGLPGWHVLTPQSASPVGHTMWFTFDGELRDGTKVSAHVCTDCDTVTHVRVEAA
jgi:hypothetical protein